ncbi:M1 family aminopeptidase [Flavobacterium luminosum]|uniref:Aminopeptidase N n=1 Tax=Flavobacterium luminosum TaxID=2949086 RepID=A0ABT0TQ66_9FLAO|nr:M1 family aminopeptidase [Flavobacterium sp. HXWNR70]MCL9809643.1 T9SS type A sorting domain-containing protein [Flavobacterium sp. HXWNR70]
MKKIFTFFYIFFTVAVFAQNNDTITIAEAEMKLASKKIGFRANPNTANYDITYSKLEFTIDPNVFMISGKVTTTFKALSNMSTVTFDLFKTPTNPFNITAVKMNGSDLVAIHNDSHELVITLPSTLTTGNYATVEITYNGIPSTGQAAFSQSTHGSPPKPIIYTLSEPYGARDWWPCKQNLNDKIESLEVYITCPSEYIGVSNGVRHLPNVVNGSNTTYHYKHNYPIPAYLVAIAVSNYTTLNTGTAGNPSFPVIDYIYPENNTTTTKNTLAKTLDIINFLETKIGPYPYNTEKYGHTQWPSNIGGMEHSTNSFMSNFNRELVSHELAHQWFGNKITCGTWQDIWLNEGLTEYMSGCVIERFDGQPAFLNWKDYKINNAYYGITSQTTGNLYLNESQTASVGRIFDYRLSYNKGAMVTHMLRYVMGDTNFFQALRNYLNDPMLAYKYAVTPQLQYHLEAVHGSSLQEFFNDWIYDEGYPIYNINAYNSGTNQVTVVINQTQSITDSTYPGYVSYFEMPVPMRLSLSNGTTQDVRLNNTFNGQSFKVTIPPGTTMTGIAFDPLKDIISKNSTTSLSQDNFELNEQVNVFPNPSKTYIEVEIPNTASLQKIQFYTILGQKAMESNASKIDISHLSNGLYTIIIETSEGKALKKFIKN